MFRSIWAFWVIYTIFSSPLYSENSESTKAPPDEAYLALERYVKILEHVKENHVDGKKTAYNRLVNHSLEGMLNSLDPFSAFYHPETYTEINQNKLNTALPSLGFTLGLRESGLYLMAVSPHSPAQKAGLKTGDSLISIDGKDAPSKLKTALSTLTAPPGISVELTLRRPHETDPITAKLTHRVVKEPTVYKARLLTEQPRIGYLRLAGFTASAPQELTQALDDLEGNTTLQGLVLDLRSNPGGYVHSASAILGEFLPPETETFSTQHRIAKKNTTYKTPKRKRPPRPYPLVILQDNNSASASELIAGTLQDLKRATIIGEQSFGKGSIHEVLPMGDGTALQITIATYHLPSGKTPHLVGVTPDKVVEISEIDRQNFELSRQPGAPELLSPEEKKQLAEWDDPLLQASLEHLKK